MNYPKATNLLLLVFFGLFSSPVDAQVNLKSGYNISIISVPALDQVLSSYNQTSGYATDFAKLKWLHGFEAGLRLKADVHALELTYQGAYQTLKANYFDADQEFSDRVRFAVHSVAIGYQASDRKFGAGTDLQYQFYKVKLVPDQNGNDYRNIQNMFALKFYFMFNFKGRQGVDMALQPYYILPFKEYDLQPFAQRLSVEPSPNNDRWNRFGLTILFYNGEK